MKSDVIKEIILRQRRRWTALLGFTLLGSMSLSGQEVIPPQMILPHAIQFPSDLLMNQNIMRGFVVVKARISEGGRVEEAICIEASHLGFVEATLSGLVGTRFVPALEAGEAVPIIVTMEFQFQAGGVVLMQSLLDDLEQVMRPNMPGKIFSLIPPNKLDEPLRPVEPIVPYVGTNEEDEVVKGSAVVDFYIDRDGSVRLLQIREATDPMMIVAAAETYEKVRYHPPMSDGKAVPTRVRQRFEVR